MKKLVKMETANNIHLSPSAIQAIEGLQHANGTFPYYDETLKRLFNYILDQSEEMGMSDVETIHTLRVLKCLRQDLKEISDQQYREVMKIKEELAGAEDPDEDPEEDLEEDPDDDLAPADDKEPGKDMESI